jgi:Fe2+ or Zn2+ uptake regulation protein
MEGVVLMIKIFEEKMTKMEIEITVRLIVSQLNNNGEGINKGSIYRHLTPLIKGKADRKLVDEVVHTVLKSLIKQMITGTG